jgi:hypothetical protein
MESMFLALFWNPDCYRLCRGEVQRGMMQEAAWFYSHNHYVFTNLFNIADILDACIYKLDIKEHDCCERHRSTARKDIVRLEAIEGAFSIIHELLNRSGPLLHELNIATKSLAMDCSPCLKLKLLNLIGKILYHPPTQ